MHPAAAVSSASREPSHSIARVNRLCHASTHDTETRAQVSHAPLDGGFTLLELAVVMFVMGLIMMIALPYLGGLKGSELRSEVRRLASRANYLCEEAGRAKSDDSAVVRSEQ